MRYSRIIVTLVLLSVVTSSFAQKEKSSYAQSIKLFRDTVATYMKKHMIPGMSVTVLVKGKQVWSEGFGYADLENQVKVDPAKTRFRIGSVSKSLTAAAMARIWEKGKINVDSSVQYYLPDYPKKQYRFTVRQLAGHIAGIRGYKGNEFYISTHYPTVTEGLVVFSGDPLAYKPGTEYLYSTHGFNLLSAVIEKAAGQDFLPLMTEQVFKPIGMNRTVADLNDSIIDHRTRFYEARGDHFINAPYVDNSYKWAGGGFISTSEDVARFGNALITDGYLKKETVKTFYTSQKKGDGTETGYGMGFGSRKDKSGRFRFGHSGGSVGGNCDMAIYPVEGVVVVVLTNTGNAGLGDLTSEVAGAFIK